MPTTYTNGLKLPDLGSIDWYNSYKNNIDILDPIVGTVNGVATTYAPISHNHSASEITSGTIDIARLPPAALERMHIVADQTARYALTTSTVQEGDTVKQTDTGVMYLVVDSTKLNSADGYTEYSAGTASKAIADEDGTSIKSGYVNVAGNQTVTGNKKFTGSNTFNGIKSTGVIRVEKSTGDTEFEIVNGEVDATTNTLSRQDDIRFYDKNTKITGGLRLTYTTDTGTKIELYARSWKADGTASYNRSLTIYTNGQTGEYYTTLETNFLPKNTSAYSLGSSSYQWSSVYAQTYYYNGTAWGLDKSNAWSNTQTVTGNDKGWNVINTDIEKGVIPSANKSSFVWWADKNNNFLGRICSRVHTDGTTMLWLSSLNYYKNGALDPTGTSATTSLILGVDANAYKFIQTNADFRPDANNTSNLGTSTNQWKSVYSQTYYYNGTAWGLDQTNNWTGSNIFTGSVILPAFGSNNYKNYGIVTDYGYTQANNYYRFLRTTGIYNTDNTPDTSKPSFLTFRPNRLQTELMDNIQVCNSGTNNYLAPITNNATDLGTSTKKWKTLNGVNPGALSLPDYNSTAKVDISGSIIPDQYNNIYYTPPINGWLYVCFNLSNATTSDSIFYIQAKDNNVANSSFVQTSWMPTSSGTSSLAIFFPVVANKRFIMQINFSNYTIIKAHVIPCLGNV